MRPFGPVCLAIVTIALTGCALTDTAAPTAQPGIVIQGKVHGGQQPIAGAHVYLFAANTTGYGGSGIAPSTANASISLLNPTITLNSDAVGAYVITGPDGSFSITGDYTCSSGQQVYLYALGGNPGAGTNSASGLLAILGACPSTGNFLASTPFVIVNEVTTVAAAYSFAGFASDALHVSSSGTPLAQTGIANAFLNAANIVSLSGGSALTTTPAGNGAVPNAKINTIANVLASCINSTGPTSSTCSTLFANTPSLTTTPVTPTDTATATINIAQNSTANPTTLYGLSTASPPFAPTSSGAPLDFSILITYSGLQNPIGVAIDAAGNVWVANSGGNNAVELSSSGVVLSGVNGFTGGGLDDPRDVAIDKSGNVWLANYSNNSVTELSSGGAPISGPGGFTGGGMNQPFQIAVDAAGAAWVNNYGYDGANYYGSVTKISSSGVALAQTNGPDPLGAKAEYGGIAIDGSGDAWAVKVDSPNSFALTLMQLNSSAGTLNTYQPSPVSNSSATAVAVDNRGVVWVSSTGSPTFVAAVSHTGANPLASPYVTGGGLFTPTKVAIDGAGNVWVNGYYNVITEFSNSGLALTGSRGISDGESFPPNLGGFAIDGSGNLWSSSRVGGYVYEIIGAATPVITPIAAGLPAVPTTDGSSNLGTRP